MMGYDVIRTSDGRLWNDVLHKMVLHDFYHLSEYHSLHEKQGDGKAILIVLKKCDKVAVLPLLIRDVSSVPGLSAFEGLYDATSVYGYAGPLLSSNAVSDLMFISQFGVILSGIMKELQVVSVFSRFHPIIGNYRWLKGVGEIVRLGSTVAIDLGLDPDQQRAAYCSNHKRNINKLRRLGARVICDDLLLHLGRFVDIYTDTMYRVNASSQYFFSLEYFKSLFSIRDRCSFHLFLCEMEGEIVSGGVFSECCGIVQYHLGATANAWLKHAPLKLVFDEVRLWAYERGNRWFHLGGGVGSAEDSLFRFKAGFSPLRFPFFIWKWIVQPEIYKDLVQARRKWYASKGLPFPEGSFFPEYRL